MSDYISRADAIDAVLGLTQLNGRVPTDSVIFQIKALPSAEAVEVDRTSEWVAVRREEYEDLIADAVQGWRIGKPTEQGSYMVTLDSFGHKHIDLFYYGKPLMPNRKVRGKCWYRSDDEWGDVVYDDKEILAWQQLPTPYKGGDDE